MQSGETLQEYVVMVYPDFMGFHVKAESIEAANGIVKTALDTFRTENIFGIEYVLIRTKVIPIEEEYPLTSEK